MHTGPLVNYTAENTGTTFALVLYISFAVLDTCTPVINVKTKHRLDIIVNSAVCINKTYGCITIHYITCSKQLS